MINNNNKKRTIKLLLLKALREKRYLYIFFNLTSSFIILIKLEQKNIP